MSLAAASALGTFCSRGTWRGTRCTAASSTRLTQRRGQPLRDAVGSDPLPPHPTLWGRGLPTVGGGRKEEEGRQPAGGRRAWPAGDALQAAAASDSITARCRAAAGGRRGPHGDAARLKGCQVPPRRGHAVGMGFSPCSSCCLACANRPLQRWGLRGDSAPCARPPSHRAALHPIGVPAVLPHALRLSPSPHPNRIPQSSPPAQHPPAFIPIGCSIAAPPPGAAPCSVRGGGGFARRVAVSLNRVVWGAWGNLGVCAMPPCPGLSPAVGHTLLGVCGPLAISLYLQDVTGPIVPLGSG